MPLTWRLLVACSLATLAATGVVPAAGPAVAAPSRPAHHQPVDTTSLRGREQVLPPGWQHSTDRLWSLRGDADGLSLYTATSASAYEWTTAATLSDPGVDTARWVGNACLTGSGRYAAVVYGATELTNSPVGLLRGGRAAIVDLDSGVVHKLPLTASMTYDDPGCGLRDDVVFSALRAEDGVTHRASRIYRVDAATAAISTTQTVPGQIDGAVPTAGGVVAMRSGWIVSIAPTGRVTARVRAGAGAGHLSVDHDGGVVFQRGTQDDNSVVRLAPGSRTAAVIAHGTGHWLGLQRGVGGRVFVLSPGSSGADLGHGSSRLSVGSQSEISTTGAMYIDDSMPASATSAPAADAAVSLDAAVTSSHRAVSFSFPRGIRPSRHADSGRAAGPAVPTTPTASATAGGRNWTRSQAVATAATMTTTANTTANTTTPTCAVPRLDPHTQVYQPTARQVEWAVDQAVVGNLLTVRPTNWKQSGLPSWAPQAMFPLPALHGGGHVPPQILLGILAQESNISMASHAMSGEFGDPLIADYYGRLKSSDGWTVNYANADCGYGIGQITDGMTAGSATLTSLQQRAIALDYETNIAEALTILIGKWNQLYDAGIIQSNGASSPIENWFFATWAYNTGYYPDKGDGTPWGVGWLNNPANPIYDASRTLFHQYESDAATPQRWPYEEKVLGWAAYPITTADGAGYRQAWWNSDTDRAAAEPPHGTFCDGSNNCTPGTGCPAVNSTCWWHKPVTYHDCTQNICGNEILRFDTTYPEQPDGTNYPPVCTVPSFLSGALIVDDVPASAPAPRDGCGHPWTDAGSFAISYGSSTAPIDFHQVGGGFGGHFYFAHERNTADQGARFNVTGTWNFSSALNQWGRVMVHLPDHGSGAKDAGYTIGLGDGTSETRYVNAYSGTNHWVSLGVFHFVGAPSISLSSTTPNGDGSTDIAFDAVAIQPLSAKPHNVVVSLGDSYASGEGASADGGGDYYPESNFGGGGPMTDGCHRSPYSWSRQMTLPGDASPVGTFADDLDPSLDYHLLACSGAVTNNLRPGGGGQYGEVGQVDAGFLDANTTLVTLSIGGNDAKFGPIIQKCADPTDTGNDCVTDNTTGLGENDQAIPALINGPTPDGSEAVKARILDVLQAIHAQAPNARILLMGYPHLISNNSDCWATLGINSHEAGWINQMTDVMGDAETSVVGSAINDYGIQVAYGSAFADFEGKGACGNPQDIHGIVTTLTDSESFKLGSQQSFHPTIGGAGDYANTANATLAFLAGM